MNHKMKIKFFIIFSFLIYNLSCAQEYITIEETWKTKDLTYLLQFGYNHRNDLIFDSICLYLIKEIQNTSYSSILVTDSIDTVTNEVISKFCLSTSPIYSDAFNVMKLCFINKDSIVIDGEIFEYSYNLKERLKQYFYSVKNGIIHLTTDTAIFKDHLCVPFHYSFYFSQLKRGMTTSEFRLYFKLFDEIQQTYDVVRNEIALKEYNIEFKKLSIKQKKSIVNFSLKNIRLYFNDYCYDTGRFRIKL